MTSFTTLVNVDVDAADKICKFVGSRLTAEAAKALFARSDELIAKKDSQQLVTLLLTKADVLLNLDNDEEVEGAFQALFSILYILGEDSSAESPAIIKTIIDSLVSDVSTATRRRLNALVTLFNITSAGSSKYAVLLAIYQYAKATNQLSKVSNFHERLNEWVASWSLTEEEQQTVYKTIAIIFQEQGSSKSALELTVQFLKALDGDLSAADAEAVVKPAVLYALSSPLNEFQQRSSLFEALGTLRLPAGFLPLVGLLRVLCDGSVADYKRFVEQADNRSVLAKHTEIDLDAIERKVKILTISSLAAEAQHKTLSYATISSALQVTVDEVEEWVVEAISEGVVVASIDQVAATVFVSRFSQRSFGPAQWRNLNTKLRDLKTRLSSVLDKIDAAAVL